MHSLLLHETFVKQLVVLTLLYRGKFLKMVIVDLQDIAVEIKTWIQQRRYRTHGLLSAGAYKR